MTHTVGWGILKRDLEIYRDEIGAKLAYLSPRRHEFEEARITFQAADKLLAMVEDYAANRKNAIDFLERVDNPQENFTLDVDNEIPEGQYDYD